MYPEHVEGEVGDERLGLAVGARAPEAPANQVPTMQRRSRGENSLRPGDAGRPELAVDDEEVELLARVAPDSRPFDVVQRLVDRRCPGPTRTSA